MKKVYSSVENIAELRRKSGLTQAEFWNKLGVTQSSGSRYESGEGIPKPIRELIRLIYVEEIDLANINRTDLAIAAMLKAQHPKIYKRLKEAIKIKNVYPLD
ncbi:MULTISPECIES: helix-turn-helix domain-containing protein [Nitrosomonas]|uniref:Helix-turn-helix protein n=1 Tax=Nitrosomonas communis TaxID=44574 RepID=A0A0F7KD56_9PROT|nr:MULTISPECIES: helix-turn-helix domain-containing protein [Nitrosomonas]AKH38445.1 XRE family transcriptional regulator [Nitrosomonas communis]TYP69657.1 helix-turn-helix protein [Nitrosomonas communis]UVS60474.1 helix-turn-helix domain-containing protein [Nitrosomonas sp. PLL12]